MKKIITYILFSILFFLVASFSGVQAKIDKLDDIGGIDKIKDVSIQSSSVTASSNPVDAIITIGIQLLTSAKLIIGGVLLIFIVYIGAQMIMSMGSDEEELGKAKRQLWYSLVALVFINIPGSLYDIFSANSKGAIDGRTGYGTWVQAPTDSSSNLFINVWNFTQTINENIVGFIEVSLSGIAVFMIVVAGIRLLMSRGQDEIVSESKNKIIWSMVALLTVGFIDVWKKAIFNGKISDGINVFETLANLALFFAGPIAILFLTFAGYYYITSNGDEEKVKKAKSIVVNTLIATVLLIASYTFLLDLATL